LITLIRVDERLIHGQVAVGWRGALDLTAFAVIDDELAASTWEKDLVLSAAPPGLAAEVVTVGEAKSAWPKWESDTEGRIVLLQSVATLSALRDAGVAFTKVNFGGLHKAEGRKEFLAYICLDGSDEAACRQLCAAGITLVGQNVPSASPVDLCRRICAAKLSPSGSEPHA
jgi:mannose/fructose/N-acetylgalactosamine-specific phosphotransferase system component IIB